MGSDHVELLPVDLSQIVRSVDGVEAQRFELALKCVNQIQGRLLHIPHPRIVPRKVAVTNADKIAVYLDSWAAGIEHGTTPVDGNEQARANQLRLAAKSVRAGDWKKGQPR